MPKSGKMKMSGDRKSRLKQMLGDRNPTERDNTAMMNSVNKARIKAKRK